MAEQQRPYYDPQKAKLQQKRAVVVYQKAKLQQKRAVVVPVAEWTIAQAMFWRKDSKKKS